MTWPSLLRSWARTGAFFRVHHFARQLASPFPLLAAVGAKTSRVEIGTAVIDMRHENPLYIAEDAAAVILRKRHGGQVRPRLVLFRRDHVCNLGRALEMEPLHLLLQHAIRIGDAFVLTQVFEPGFDQNVSTNRAGSAASRNTPHA